MPGHAQLTVDLAAEEARRAQDLGVGGLILFGIPDRKDSVGGDSYRDDGIVQRAVAAIKEAAPEMLIITDV